MVRENKGITKEVINKIENDCEMTEEEKSFFDIEEDSPIANTKFENPMYNKGYDDGFADGTNSIEE